MGWELKKRKKIMKLLPSLEETQMRKMSQRYDVTIDPTGDLVRQIFEEIMVLEVGLIDYRLEN